MRLPHVLSVDVVGCFSVSPEPLHSRFRQVAGVSDCPEERGCIAVGQRPRVRVLGAWTPGRTHRMQAAGDRVLALVSGLVVDVPIGTKLGLLHVDWMVRGGKLRRSRGASFPGWSAVGLSA